jgi:hypothetical protein
MAKPNYNFEKRQRELSRKKKQDEKRRRKLEKSAAAAAPGEPEPVLSPLPPEAE